MTVADLEGRMSNAEFVGWAMYFALQAQKRELAERTARR